MFINGENRILYIKINGEFLPIGCLTGDSFSETVEMLNTTTRDNAGWATSTPTTQSYNISFEGLVIKTSFLTGGDTTKVSFDRLKELKRNRTLIEWKSEDIDNTFVESGKGFITELSDSSSIDDFISFNASIVGYGKPNETSFITTWRTTTNNETIVIGLDSSEIYNFRVDWGDNSNQTVTGNLNLSHTYSVPGDYLVKINGIFPRINMSAFGTTPNNLISINNWGIIQWTSMNSAFKNCINLYNCNSQDVPDLSNVTNLLSMFENAGSNTSNLFINNINKWDTKNITKISSMFKDATSFNQNINAWDVSNVTSMVYVFDNATSFNQPLNNWNTGNVINMFAMFRGATSFNQDLSLWNVSNVIGTSQMFKNATSFNQLLNSWETNTYSTTSNIENMSSMFENAIRFEANLNLWDTSGATNINYMFRNINETGGIIEVSNWDVSNVTQARFAFAHNPLSSLDLSDWDTSSMTNIQGMFQGTDVSNFSTNIEKWNMSNVLFAFAFMSSYDGYEPKFPLAVYDNILNAFANETYHTTPTNLSIHFGESQYTTAGSASRNKLTTPVSSGGFGWTITDGGLV
jgi:surface protein